MVTIDKIKKEDYPELASFMTTHWPHGKQYWLDRFLFLWDKNPAFSEDPIRGVVVKDNDRILGFIGKFPVKFLLNGNATVSSNGIGLLLDSSLRGSGMGKKLKDKHTELSKGKFIFATSPNKISLKINKALGFKLLPRDIGTYNLYSLLPVNASNSLKLMFHLFKVSRSLAPLSVTNHNLGVMKNKLFSKHILQDNSDKTLKIHHAGDEFDLLWDKTKNLYKNTNIRNAEIINWYLQPTKYAEREVYATYSRDTLMGFIVVRPTMFKGLRLMLCVDLWVRPENRKNTIKSLITFAEEQAEEKKYSAILLPHFSKALSRDLDGIGLFKIIGAKRNELYLKPKNYEAIIEDENSYFTYMNGDRFLSRFTI